MGVKMLKRERHRDLRDLIERIDELAIVDNADWDLEIGAIAETVTQQNPGRSYAVLFDNIKVDLPGFSGETLAQF